MLTMAPPPWSRMIGATAWVIRKGPVRLTARTRCHSSSVTSSIGLNTAMPALLTRASMRPNCRRTCSTAASIAAGSETSASSARAASARPRALTVERSVLAQDIEHRNMPAVVQEAGRRCEADAARRAGDKGNLLQPRRHAVFLPCFVTTARLCTPREARQRAQLAARQSNRLGMPKWIKPLSIREENWSGRRDSNPRPRPWQGRALPLSYARAPIRPGRCRKAVLIGLFRRLGKRRQNLSRGPEDAADTCRIRCRGSARSGRAKAASSI